MPRAVKGGALAPTKGTAAVLYPLFTITGMVFRIMNSAALAACAIMEPRPNVSECRCRAESEARPSYALTSTHVDKPALALFPMERIRQR